MKKQITEENENIHTGLYICGQPASVQDIKRLFFDNSENKYCCKYTPSVHVRINNRKATSSDIIRLAQDLRDKKNKIKTSFISPMSDIFICTVY